MPLYRKSIINERMYPMENQFLKEKSTHIIQQVQDDLYAHKQCVAAYLLGSYSHDKVWEWSDIEIAVILDDDYKGKPYYDLYAEDRWLSLNVYTLTNFKEFIETVNEIHAIGEDMDHLFLHFNVDKEALSSIREELKIIRGQINKTKDDAKKIQIKTINEG